MSWKIAFAVGLANAVTAFVVTVVVGFGLMSLLNIHDREGGGSMGIFFVYAPFAFAVALIWGLVASGIVGASGWSQFWRAFGLAQFLPNAVLLTFFAFKVVTRPIAPTLDGLALDLEAEVFVPVGLMPEDALRHQYTRASLYASDRDNEFITVDRDRIVERDSAWVVPLRGRINTPSARRMLSFTANEQRTFTLDMYLSPKPFERDTTWSEVRPMRKDLLPDGTRVPSGASARYRVVKVPRQR